MGFLIFDDFEHQEIYALSKQANEDEILKNIVHFS